MSRIFHSHAISVVRRTHGIFKILLLYSKTTCCMFVSKEPINRLILARRAEQKPAGAGQLCRILNTILTDDRGIEPESRVRFPTFLSSEALGWSPELSQTPVYSVTGKEGIFPQGKAAVIWSWLLTSILCWVEECLYSQLRTNSSPWYCAQFSTGTTLLSFYNIVFVLNC